MISPSEFTFDLAYLSYLNERLSECIGLNKDKVIVYECGVFRGRSAYCMGKYLAEYHNKKDILFRLFDTFYGMPEVSKFDNAHVAGGFSNVSYEEVKEVLKEWAFFDFNVGIVPATFSGKEKDVITFAHLDMDIYESTKTALEFIFPRLIPGGEIVLHDYSAGECAGVTIAVDNFMKIAAKDISNISYHTPAINIKKKGT